MALTRAARPLAVGDGVFLRHDYNAYDNLIPDRRVPAGRRRSGAAYRRAATTRRAQARRAHQHSTSVADAPFAPGDAEDGLAVGVVRGFWKNELGEWTVQVARLWRLTSSGSRYFSRPNARLFLESAKNVGK